MKDERSRKAVEVAIAYGEDRATEEELNDITAAAVDVVAAANAAATYTAYAACAAAKKTNQLEAADICRKYLTEEVFKLII